MTQSRQFCFPQLLRECLHDKLQGEIAVSEIEATSGTASIFVDDGMVIGATTDVAAIPAGADPARRATLLVELLCRTRRAEAEFEVSLANVPDDRLALAIPNLLITGVKSIEDTSVVIDWLGDKSVELVASPDLFQILGTAVLEPQEGYFVSQLSQAFVLGATLDGSAIGRDAAARLLCALRFANAIVPTSGVDTWMTEDDALPAAAPDVDMVEVARVCYLVDEKLRAIEDGADYYAVLDVERRAPRERIKANYRELAKMFHPDRHAQLATYSEDIKDRLEAIFTGLTEAYQTLSHPRDREAYDKKLGVRDQATAVQTPVPERPPVIPTPKPPPAAARPAAPAPPRPEPPPPPPPHAPPVESTPREAPPEKAKVPGDGRGRVETRKAHQDDLSRKPGRGCESGANSANGAKRPAIPVPIVPPIPKAPKPPPASAQPSASAPVPTAQKPPPAPPPKLNAETLYEHGTGYVAAGDYERAVQAFMRGVELAPRDARMHAALGGALADLHGLDKSAEASLRKAVEIDPTSAELFVEIASIYQRCGRENEARTLFKRALMLDPQNADASAALGGKRVNREVSDFFKSIFKK